MQKRGCVNGEPALRGKNKNAEGRETWVKEEKVENSQENEDTTVGSKKRKRNRKHNKGMPKSEPVKEEPAVEGENKNAKEKNAEENEDTPPGAKKRKRQRKHKKEMQEKVDTAEEEDIDGSPAKRVKTESLNEDTEKANEAQPADPNRPLSKAQKKRQKKKKKRRQLIEALRTTTTTSNTSTGQEPGPETNEAQPADPNRPLSKGQKKKKRRQLIEALHTTTTTSTTSTRQEPGPEVNEAQPADTNRPLSKDQKKKKKRKQLIEALHTTTTTSTTSTRQEPGPEGTTKARKRKLGAAEVWVPSAINIMQKDDAATRKMKKESPGDNEDAAKRKRNEADVSIASAINSKQNDEVPTKTTKKEGSGDNADAKKNMQNDAGVPIVSNGQQNSVPAKKIKRESQEESNGSRKEPTTLLNNAGQAKKRKRKKKKQSHVTGDSTIEVHDVGDKEAQKSNSVKKLKTDNTETRDTEPEDAMLNKKRKKNKKKKKMQEGIETSTQNISNRITAAGQTQPGAPTASIDTMQDKGRQAPTLHPLCTSRESMKRISECWKGGSKEGRVLEAEGSIEVIKNPFTCCYVPQLLQDEAFLEGVKKELDKVKLLNKNNDLYKFRQTGDLRKVTTPFIAGLRHLLYTDVRQWLIEVTGIPLSDTVDMGSSRYDHTDVLLCHDDELEGRRIAYILYLVPPWGPGDGGTLDLFATDGDGHPSDIVRSLVPKNNAFAFFEVSPVSFHQVSEVLSRNKTRLSINGWFHGPPIPRPRRNPHPPSPLKGPIHLEEEAFYAWINPMYLDMNIQKEIRQKFCSESELELENFLTDEAYERLSSALRNGDLAWQRVGPADRQCYEVLGQDSMPQDVRECRQFLGSEALFLVLSQLTGLKLHPMAPQDSDDDEEDEEEQEAGTEPNPRCHTEAQRWVPGCYTLIRDDCVDNRSALDAFLYANVSQRWHQQLGGHVTYIAKDEDEELLTVVPQSNCLCLVYRDSQTLRFTKYINSAARDLGANHSHFHNFACTYYE